MTNIKSTTGFPMSYRESVHVTLSPEGVARKAIFSFFGIKVNFNRIKSATKFLCVKPPAASCSTIIPVSNGSQILAQTVRLQPKI